MPIEPDGGIPDTTGSSSAARPASGRDVVRPAIAHHHTLRSDPAPLSGSTLAASSGRDHGVFPMTRSILCFGEALIDLHAGDFDERGFAQQLRPFAGGAPANTAVAIARLGGHARFAGMLAQDRFGDFLLDSLQQAGVDTADVARTDAANTALAFITLDALG
jgi:hypothetical protein